MGTVLASGAPGAKFFLSCCAVNGFQSFGFQLCRMGISVQGATRLARGGASAISRLWMLDSFASSEFHQLQQMPATEPQLQGHERGPFLPPRSGQVQLVARGASLCCSVPKAAGTAAISEIVRLA